MSAYEMAYGKQSSDEQPSPSRPSPSQLPPAALDLAARLFALARAGDTSTLSQYISAGIPKNLTNASGDTLLMLASYHGHAETAKMLIEVGADVNILNGRGQSPIGAAVFKGHMDVVRVLHARGADVTLGQPSAVDCARMFKRADCLKLFGLKEEEEEEEEMGTHGPS